MSEIVAEGIVEARALRQYAGVFTPLSTEGRIHFNDDGLTTRVVDPAGVAMVNPGSLDRRAFESYDAPGSVTIGVSLERLTDRLKPADPGQLVQLQVDMEDRKLRIEYGRSEQTLGLIDPEAIRKEPNTPDLGLPNTVTLTADDLDDALTIADMVSDHVTLWADPDDHLFTVFAEGDTDDSRTRFGDDDLLEASVTEATESAFSLDYFEDLANPIPTDAEVSIRFGEEMPMELAWGGVDGHLSVESVLAPRIQSD